MGLKKVQRGSKRVQNIAVFTNISSAIYTPTFATIHILNVAIAQPATPYIPTNLIFQQIALLVYNLYDIPITNDL